MPIRGTPAMGDQPRGIEKCAVAADGDDQVGALGDFVFRDARDEVRGRVERVVFRQKRADAALLEMRQEGQRGLGNARVAESAYERASLRR